MQEMASEINKIQRSPPFLSYISIKANPLSQATSYKRKFEAGSFIRIHQRTTTLHSGNTTMELHHGLFKAILSRNGERQALSCGFMVNVRVFPICSFAPLDDSSRTVFSGFGEERSLVSIP